MEEKRLQMSESFFLTAILAIVGGFLDSYSYLMRGHVFANAQTGNIVLFGVNLQKRDFTQAFYYFVPILAFAVGVIPEMLRPGETGFIRKNIRFIGDRELWHLSLC